jgi:hypothetical protein
VGGETPDAGAPPTLAACQGFTAELAEGKTCVFEEIREATGRFYRREQAR